MQSYLNSFLYILQVNNVVLVKQRFIIYAILISFSFPGYSDNCQNLFNKKKANDNNSIYPTSTPKKLLPALPSLNIDVLLEFHSKAKLFNTQESRAKNQFRRAFNKRELNNNDRYISFKSDIFKREHFAEVTSITPNDVLVKLVANDGAVIESTLSRKELRSAKTNIDSKELFKKMNHAVEKLKSFNISKTNEEADLKKQDYKPIFYKGLDEVNWMKDLAIALRKSNANPYKTHIEDFALKINDTIKFVKKGILSSGKEIIERRAILKYMTSEAQKRVQNKKVTYQWWIHWNQRLSVLATLSAQREKAAHNNWWQTEKSLQQLLNTPSDTHDSKEPFSPFASSITISNFIQTFPSKIIFPSTQPIGLFAFNKANGEGIIPVHLSNEQTIVDGVSYTTESLFTHDILHAFLGFGNLNRLSFDYFNSKHATYNFKKQFHNLLMEKERSLSKEDRKKIAIAYFLLTHEVSYNTPIRTPNLKNELDIYQVLLDNIKSFENEHDLQAVLPDHIYTKNDIKDYLKEVSATFALITQQVLQKMNKQWTFLLHQVIR